jgi:hypothetical protein
MKITKLWLLAIVITTGLLSFLACQKENSSNEAAPIFARAAQSGIFSRDTLVIQDSTRTDTMRCDNGGRLLAITFTFADSCLGKNPKELSACLDSPEGRVCKSLKVVHRGNGTITLVMYACLNGTTPYELTMNGLPKGCQRAKVCVREVTYPSGLGNTIECHEHNFAHGSLHLFFDSW